LFHNESSLASIPFDIFSAIFYIISRYEEYLPHSKDKHGRYPHSESILYKNGQLHIPIVDVWVDFLRNEINKKFGLTLTKKPFNIQLTYDIDIAYSYKCKGLVRNFGGAIRDISKGKIGLFFSRISTLLGLTKDPYDAFDFLFSLHNQYNFKPHYFTLLSEKNTDFDKNISPQSTEMQLLIKQLYNDGDVGIHPSYYTKDNNQLLAQEINTLTTITSQYITTSRQHYIRNFLPATYKQLMASGITEDYSMGYATEMGFRAGTSHSFLWYDFSNETITDLRIYPFCFMDTTARYDLGLDVNEAFNRLATMTNSVKQFGGNIYTIFHNFSLGNDGDWKGYKEHYEQWIALNTVTK
jgi:hypothetical protein